MQLSFKDIAASTRSSDTRRMSRSAAIALAPGRVKAGTTEGRSRRQGRAGGLLRSAAGGVIHSLLGRPGARQALVTLLCALVIGGLIQGAWTLITWTPLPPQQFAAELSDLPPSRRDAACTRLAVQRARGPYDASMLSYAFDPRSGLCQAIEEDDFRARVLEARARHQNVAWVLAILATLGSLHWGRQRARQGGR